MLKLRSPGQNEVVTYLNQLALTNQTSYEVGIFGDTIELYQFAMSQIFPKDKGRLHFSYDRVADKVDFVVLVGDYPDLLRTLGESYPEKILPTSEFEFVQGGFKYMQIFRMPSLLTNIPRKMSIKHGARRTGDRSWYIGTSPDPQHSGGEKSSSVTVAFPTQHKAGYLITGISVRAQPGTLVVRYYLALPRGIAETEGISSAQAVVRLGADPCQRIVTLSELSADEFRPIEVICPIKNSKRVRIDAFWLAEVPVIFSGVDLYQ